jgi:hypothetical protein
VDDVEEQREINAGKLPGGVTGKGFMPGQSGNPGGRPKGLSITAHLRELLALTDIDGRPLKDEREAAREVALCMLKKGTGRGARKANMEAIKEILDRTEGKVPVQVQLPAVDLEAVRDKLTERRAKRAKDST